MNSDCEHNYQFQGVVYSDGTQLPGTGACERIYEDAYFCTKCLHVAHLNRRVVGNTYVKAIAGAMPK